MTGGADPFSGSQLVVEELGPSQDADISDFLDHLCRDSPSVLGYHYPFYRDMLVKLQVGKPLYLGVRSNGSLLGILPVFSRQSDIGVVYNSLPFFGPNGGVLCHGGPSRQEIHQALLANLLDRVRREKALSCSLYTPFLFGEFRWYEHFQPDACVHRTTLYTDLTNVDWNSGIKYDLRRARRLGVEISSEVTPGRLAAFYDIYWKTCLDRGIPVKPRASLEFLAGPELLDQRTRIYFALSRDEVIAGLLVVFSRATASYYIPCTRDDFRTLQPGTLLVDRAVSDMRSSGLRFWNWEASPDRESGVYSYKKKWNSIESSYRVYIWCPCGTEALKGIGKDRFRTSFPAFYVYPYDQL